MTIRGTRLTAAAATGFHTAELQHWKRNGPADAASSGQVVSSEPRNPPVGQRQTDGPPGGLTAGKPLVLIQGFGIFSRHFPEG